MRSLDSYYTLVYHPKHVTLKANDQRHLVTVTYAKVRSVLPPEEKQTSQASVTFPFYVYAIEEGTVVQYRFSVHISHREQSFILAKIKACFFIYFFILCHFSSALHSDHSLSIYE